MFRKMYLSLKRIDYRMFAALLIFGIVPTIYTTVRIFLLGQLPISYSFSIAGQLQWVNVLYEILQESIILPLFFFIGAVVANKDKLINRIKTALIFTILVYFSLSLLIFIFARPLVLFMAQDQSIINETVRFIRLETIAQIFMTSVKFIMVVLVTIKKDKNLYIVLIAQLLLTVFFDLLLFSSLPFSLNAGVNGIPISNIIVNVILFGFSLWLLKFNGINIFTKSKLDFKWFPILYRVGGLSGLETLVRNVAFILMVVRMVNMVGEQGTFWVANNFIWGWLLLPIIQLGELIKAHCGEEKLEAVKSKSLGYFTITFFIVIIWFISIPLWKPFMRDVLQYSGYQDVFMIAIISLGFYVLFAFNNVIDSIFYGLGKTDYMLIQSVLVNTIFYGTLFVLFKIGVYQPNLILIALMFALGIAIDALITVVIFVWMLRKKRISITRNEYFKLV
jgi:Na+-driven multidrug efflux pump